MKIRAKKKKAIFVCQFREGILKVAKCPVNNTKGECAALEVEAIPSDMGDKHLAEKLNQIFKKLEYADNPLIVSLPRNQATCRYLKIPSQTPREIERMVALQASRYLPYPANELITAYQVISRAKEGHSEVNLIIAHKDTVERYLKIFREIKIKNFSIILSSYGLSNLFSYLKPEETSSAMLIDIDSDQAELAIVADRKLLFSRFFKLDQNQTNWKALFIDEVNKSRDAYLKEVSLEAPEKIFVMQANKPSQIFLEPFSKEIALPVSGHSFASLIGLGLLKTEESLHLLPQEIKEKQRRVFQFKQYLGMILIIFSIIAIWILIIFRNFDNKIRYFSRIQAELNKIAKEAKPLEKIERRLRLFQGQSKRRTPALDALYELHQVIPAQISLTNFAYEDAQVVLRGQTQELNSVFIFVAQLEKSPVFGNFNIKVRYASQKKTQLGEMVDFEIICLKSE